MSRVIISVCLALFLTSVSYGEVIGDWEGIDDGWAPGIGVSFTYSNDPRVVTRGNYALGVWASSDWQIAASRTFSNAEALAKGFGQGQIITIDVSMLAEEWELGGTNPWGVKPLENLIIQSSAGWWQQLSPWQQPDYSGLGNHDGIWKPEYGDAQFTYTFMVPAQTGIISDLTISMIQNRGDVDIAGAVYYDNMEILPEPATMALMGLGGLALLRRKK